MKKYERGSLTLEMSIVLPIFIFMFLFIFGTINIIHAQNKISHAMIQAIKSASLDPYLNERDESYAKKSSHMWADFKDFVNDLIVRSGVDNSFFASKSDWYKINSFDPTVISERFVGYFSGGDLEKADGTLRNLGIKNGLEGMHFSVVVYDNVMTVTIKWDINYWFDFWGIGKIPMEQTYKQRLWLD